MYTRFLCALRSIGHRRPLLIAPLLLASLAIAGCGTPASVADPTLLASPTPTVKVVPPATREPVTIATPERPAEAHRLVILHTNDVMGETAPCG